MLENVKKILNLKHKDKIISYEYILGIILAFGLWGYHLINTAVISQSIAQKCKYIIINYLDDYKIPGLEQSHFNWMRDLTDHQWRNFRKSLPLIFVFAGIFLVLSNLTKKYLPKYIKLYYLLIGLGYAIYLHHAKFIFLLGILLFNFYLTKVYNLLGSKIFTFLTWSFCILMKVLSDIYGGFSFKSFFPSMNEQCQLNWHLVFGVVMLRMISFNMEFKALFFNVKSDSPAHCKDCLEGKYCLKFLSNSPTKFSDYTLINYLTYIFYPPLYFSGPIILFNSFIFQINNISTSDHQNLFTRDKIKYILRFIIVFISFEVFNSFVYVNAYLTSYSNKFIWESFDYYTYSVFCFFLLIFIWFKFTVIWRTARLWAWVDGIYTEENMNRCMYNNYSFEGFWRAWHRSFNIWLIRYIFIPLGGSKYKMLNIWVIFSFVALWHDLKLNLLIWGWFVCLFLMPEILVKNYFNQESKQYLNDKLWFRFVKYLFCAFYIVLMVIANLIGFGMGHEGLIEILFNILKMTSLFYFIKILLFLVPTATVMFYVREQEALSNNSNGSKAKGNF